jgi:hypothetical protein
MPSRRLWAFTLLLLLPLLLLLLLPWRLVLKWQRQPLLHLQQQC